MEVHDTPASCVCVLHLHLHLCPHLRLRLRLRLHLHQERGAICSEKLNTEHLNLPSTFDLNRHQAANCSPSCLLQESAQEETCIPFLPGLLTFVASCIASRISHSRNGAIQPHVAAFQPPPSSIIARSPASAACPPENANTHVHIHVPPERFPRHRFPVRPALSPFCLSPQLQGIHWTRSVYPLSSPCGSRLQRPMFLSARIYGPTSIVQVRLWFGNGGSGCMKPLPLLPAVHVSRDRVG